MTYDIAVSILCLLSGLAFGFVESWVDAGNGCAAVVRGATIVRRRGNSCAGELPGATITGMGGKGLL